MEFDPNYKFHFHFDNTELILHFELEIEQNDEWHKVGQAELNLVQGMYDHIDYNIVDFTNLEGLHLDDYGYRNSNFMIYPYLMSAKGSTNVLYGTSCTRTAQFDLQP